MFCIDLSPTYAAPISHTLPGGVRAVFRGVFHRMTESESEELLSKLSRSELSAVQAVVRVLAGWEEVADAKGEPLPFTPDNLSKLLAMQGMSAAIVYAWARSLREVEEKN
jgi:hypothetical protein